MVRIGLQLELCNKAWLLAGAFGFYVGGVLTGAVACGSTYLSQALFSHKLKPWGEGFRTVTILLVIFSYFAFGYGGWTVYEALKTAFLPISGI